MAFEALFRGFNKPRDRKPEREERTHKIGSVTNFGSTLEEEVHTLVCDVCKQEFAGTSVAKTASERADQAGAEAKRLMEESTCPGPPEER